MKKTKRGAKPEMISFVGDSLAGNEADEQAVQFDKAVGIDAVILTKDDTDAKGGAALSIAKAVGRPILFLGVGQESGDIVQYDPQLLVDRTFETAYGLPAPGRLADAARSGAPQVFDER